MTSITKEMKSEIDKLWNSLWSGGIANPLNAMEQISYFLYMRRLSVLDHERKNKAEFTGDNYISIFSQNHDCDWDYWKHLEGEMMLFHVRDKVFPWMKSDLATRGDTYAQAMKDAVFIIPKGSLMVEMVSTIDRIYELISVEENKGQQFNDVQGDIYEEFLSEIASAGKNGQFRTPRHIIQMMAQMLNPKLGETICDPAGGTAGFLLAAYQHIITSNTSNVYKQKDRFGLTKGGKGDLITNPKHWDFLQNKSLFGYDFDTTMVRIAIMNLIVHGIDKPNFHYQDTLSKSFDNSNTYDVILANPPFTGKIDEGDIWEGARTDSPKSELLFLDKILQMLKSGGRAAIIVPNGVLSTVSNAHTLLRRVLIEECSLNAVISMPSGVFKPYTPVSTSILFLTKGEQTSKVWYYKMEADGLTLNDKRDETDLCDIPEILELWEKPNQEVLDDRAEKSFFVDYSEIVSTNYILSLTKYQKLIYESKIYEKPSDLISKFRDNEYEILNSLDRTESLLNDYYKKHPASN